MINGCCKVVAYEWNCIFEFTIAFYCIYPFCCETQCWKDQRQSAAAAAWVAAHENDKVRALTPAWARRWVDVPCSRPAPAPAPPQPPIVGQTSSVQPSNHMNTLTARTAAPLPCTGPVLRPGHIQFNISIMIDYPGYKHFKRTIWSKM